MMTCAASSCLGRGSGCDGRRRAVCERVASAFVTTALPSGPKLSGRLSGAASARDGANCDEPD